MRLIKTATLAALLLGVAGTASASVITSQHHNHHNQHVSNLASILSSYSNPYHGQGVLQIGHLTLRWGNNGHWVRVKPRQTPVPEPTTLALLGAGLLGMGLVARRRTLSA